MAKTVKEYEGYPKFFKKDGAPNLVAHKPADAVNFKARGYTEAKVEVPEAKVGGADSASAVAGSAQAPKVDTESNTGPGSTRPRPANPRN